MAAELARKMFRRSEITRIARFRCQRKQNATGKDVIDIVFLRIVTGEHSVCRYLGVSQTMQMFVPATRRRSLRTGAANPG